MYLSKLEIFGFKSFAHKVTFQFNDGITAIIGPNGCGKSNIVDAIRWVLGEQRTSMLRLDRMENIIFNGTATRKPLSMAEVSLYIENTKNILPSIYTEVKITRRLYRSGESEYLINNRQVRLKDVIDLFSDTGMGSDAYSVIELKMVEQILSENAEERRRLFEEAAGIKKYKLRRRSALRKLDTTQQELTRLNDVIAEVRKTVNSLSRQVGKARRYHQYKDAIRQNELYLHQLRLRNYRLEVQPLREEYQQVRQTRERLGKDVTQSEAALEKLQLQVVDLEHRFREVAGRLNDADEQVREIQQRVRLKEQKIESLQENIERTRREIEDHRDHLAELTRHLKETESRMAEVQAAADARYREYQEKANRQLEAEGRLEEMRKVYQDFRSQNISEMEQITRQREDFQKIQLQKSNLLEQKERLVRQKSNLEKEIAEKRNRLSRIEEEWQETQDAAILFEQEKNLLQSRVAELEQQRRELEEKKNEQIGKIEKLRSQKEFLERLIHSYEGFSETVQYVMARKQNYRGVIDTLANMVDTSPEYRPALESFLGEVANYLVVEEVETARNILNEIRHQKKGRLTLIPLSLLNTSPNGKPELKELNGEAIPLKEVVRFDSRFAPLFNFLFDRVILVKDMEAALRWYRQFPHYNFLTRDGELLGEWGQITGGNSHQNLNLVGRKQEFSRLDKQLSRLEQSQQSLEQELTSNQAQTALKKQKIEEFENLLREQQKKANQLQQQVHQQNYELDRMLELRQQIEADLEAIVGKIDEMEKREKTLLPGVEEAGRKQQELQQEESRLNSDLEKADQDFRRVSREVQQLQIDFLQQKNLLNELRQKQAYLQKTLQDTGQQIERSEKEIEGYREEIRLLEEENRKDRQELDRLYEGRDEIEKQKLEVENKYQSLKSVIMAREEEVKKLHRRWNQSLERLKELELRIQEIEIKQKTGQEQMVEKYGENLPELLEQNPVPEGLGVQQIQEELSQLRQKIESLGEVNPLAIKEHEREKERLDFLTSQQEDLLEAREELLETISKLNKTARKLFLDTFYRINENFKTVFGKFFEGGEAELHLVENGDPLETNIEISVKIKGKRLSTLTLLSAGEKTLTAISLLFSIYLVKPSPFCILDEVDAPLDDVNISRYTHALKEFSRDTQFILVTHNKMTMQAAQAMYGITMEEQGVSKVVSVRFD